MALDYWIEDTDKLWFKGTFKAGETRTYKISKIDGYSPNGDGVFEFFDDFDDDLTKWSFTGTPTISESKLEIGANDTILSNSSFDTNSILESLCIISPTNYHYFGFNERDGNVPAFPTVGFTYGWPTTNTFQTRTQLTSSGSYQNFIIPAIGVNNQLESITRIANTSVIFKTDDVVVSTHTQNINDDELFISINSSSEAEPQSEFEWIRVRKYIPTEPTIEVTDNFTYYTVSITNNMEETIEDYQISIDATEFESLENTQSLEIIDTSYVSWSYHATIAITNPSATADVQASFTFDKLAGMNADYSDIRFATTDGAALSYWIEASDESSATVWIKLPADDTEILMYYGNSEAVSESSGDDTFEFFDDFSGSSIDLTKWPTNRGVTISDGIANLNVYDTNNVSHDLLYSNYTAEINTVMECLVSSPTNTAGRLGFASVSTSTLYSGPDAIGIQLYADHNLYTDTSNNSAITQINNGEVYDSSYNKYKFMWTSNNVSFYKNNTFIVNHTTNIPLSTDIMHVIFRDVISINYVYIRKYVEIEPEIQFYPTSYPYSIILDVKNPSATEGVQVKFELPLQDNMEADFSQLYFSKTDDLTSSGRIPYWIESSDEASAEVWVKLPADIDVIRLSWGNSDAVMAAPSGDDTFEFFDDCNSGNPLDSWAIAAGTNVSVQYTTESTFDGTPVLKLHAQSGSAVIAAKTDFVTSGIFEANVLFNGRSNFFTAFADNVSYTFYGYRPNDGGSQELYKCVNDVFTLLTSNNNAHDLLTWASIKISITDTGSIRAYYNNDLALSTTNTSITSGTVGLRTYTDGTTMYADNIRMRKYVEIEPELVLRTNYRALFAHRATITVTDPSSTEDVQVMFELPLLRDMAADYADIRFSTTGGRALAYWIEASDETSATVWVKLPAVDPQIYMYWGMVDAISESSPDDTFEFFDDFTDDLSKWVITENNGISISDETLSISMGSTNYGALHTNKTVGPSTIIETYIYTHTYSTAIGLGATDYSGIGSSIGLVASTNYESAVFTGVVYPSPNRWSPPRAFSFASTEGDIITDPPNVWYKQTFIIPNGAPLQAIQNDDTPIVSTRYNGITDAQPLHIKHYRQYGAMYIDWIRVRKYVSTQPTLTLSTGYLQTDLNQHTIAVQYPSAVADVQTLFTLLHRDGMQSDYSDLRFAGWGSENRPYWIESSTSSSASIWISLPADDTFIYYYWGDDTAVAASSGADTFDAFVADDLTDWDVYTATDCTVSIVNDALEFYVPAAAGAYAYIKSKDAMTGEFVIESVAAFSHQDVNAETFSSIGLGFPYFIDGNGVVIRDYSSGDIKIAVEQKTGETTTAGDIALIGDASTENQRYYLTSKDDSYVGYLTDTGTLDRLVETDNKVILGITTDSTAVPAHDSHVYTQFAFVRKYVEIQPILTQGEFSDGDNLALWGRSVDILLDVETVVDNQQVLVTLPFLKNMADDFSDIRFANEALEQMPHWIDSKEDLVEAKVWVNVPTSGSTSIKCLYKMADAEDGSDGPRTFDVFDHFEGTSPDSDVWYTHEGTPVVADSIVNLPATRIKTFEEWDLGYAVHAMVRRVPDIDDSIGFNNLVGASRESITTASGSFFMARNSNTIDYVKTVDTELAEDTNWHIRDVAASPSGSIRLSVDNNLLYTETDPTYVYASGSIPVTLYGGQVDWFSIRKAVDVEPVATVDVDALYSTWAYSDIITFDIPTIVENQLCSVVITARDGMNSDFSDLRFATRQGTELRYAMEPPEYTSSAKFWLEIQSIGTTEVIAFWGKADAEDESQWDDLFPIMHEFFEEGIDAEKWPTATGAIVTDGPDQTYTIGDSKDLVSLPITTSAHQIEFEIKWTSYSSNGPRLSVYFGDTKHYIEIYANGTGPSTWHDVWLGTRAGAELSRVERAWSLNKWYTFKIVSTPTLQKVIISNNNVSLTGAHASTVEYTGTIIFDSWDNNALRIKDIKVRPYIAQDPVLSFPDSIGAADDILTDFVAPITGLETQIESFLAGLPYESSNSSNDTRTREIPALFESILGSISTIDGNTSYLETFLDAVWSQPLASADETRERTTPTLVMSNIGGSGIPDILVEYAYDVFVSSTRLKTIGAALRTTVRNRPGNSTRMDVPFNSMELGEPYETTPLELDGLMRTGVDDSYIEGFKLPIIAHVNRISGAIFPNSVVILEGVSNKVLTQTDYRGIIIDWIPFDEYNNAIFVSANNIVYTQLSKEEVELYVFNYIINRASIANAPFRMVHSRLG